MLAEIPTAEYAQALDRCVADLVWEAAWPGPPYDTLAIARRLGIRVARDGRLNGRARFVRIASQRTARGREAILLRDDPRPERRHWAVAHEIGEARADRVFALLGVDPYEAPLTARERVADGMAGRLLAPTRELRRAWREFEGDLPAIKAAFATASYELLGMRLLDALRTPIVVTVTDHNRVKWRRWNLSGPAPPRGALETQCQRRTHTLAEPSEADGREDASPAIGPPIERVRCWPVHEPTWRREVTVTELYADEPDWR